MNWKIARVLIAIPLSFLISGCFDFRELEEFLAESFVDGEGGLERVTRYVADTEDDVEAIEGHYLLPPGGAWVAGRRACELIDGTKAVCEKSVYQLARRFAASEAIPADFVRPAKHSPKSARNQIGVRVKSYWFVDKYQYEEVFQDVVTKEGLSSAVRKFYELYLNFLSSGLGQVQGANVTADQAREKLCSHFDPLIEEALSVFFAKCMDTDNGLGDCYQVFEEETLLARLFEMIEDDDLIVEEVSKIFPPPEDYEEADWRTAILTKVSMSEPNDFATELETLLETEWEELAGVLDFFESSPDMEVRLSMPGNSITNNAHSHETGALIWRFGMGDFTYHEYVLLAQSRVIHYHRIVSALAALLVILILLRQLTQRSKEAVNET